MSTTPIVLNADDTTLAAAQRNILANSVEMVKRLNADLKTRYNQAYADYVTNMQSGGFVPEERRKAPVPPFAWELAPANEDGFVFYQVSLTQRVCSQPADTYYAAGNPQPNTQPNVIMIGGQNGNTKWYTAQKGDTFPSGMITPPQPDGHTYEKFGAPVGPGWYLQIS